MSATLAHLVGGPVDGESMPLAPGKDAPRYVYWSGDFEGTARYIRRGPAGGAWIYHWDNWES